MTADRAVRVDLGERSYTITVGTGILERLTAFMPFDLQGRTLFVLTDHNVAGPHAAALCDGLRRTGARSVEMLAMPPGEQTKCMVSLEQVLGWLLDHRADRRSVLFALGGGVIGDLGGLAASLVMRGIPFIQIPTSLLAQVDSSVGGKTGINMPQGKNLVGAFYQPAAVLCDLNVLKTLPRREILAGYAEIVKYGLLGDAEFFVWLEKEGAKVCALESESVARAVEISCRKKAEIVAADEREQDMRALLNLGHTFGHALEAAAGYDGRLLHGEAVAIGIVLAFRLSARTGRCPEESVERVISHFKAMGLPTEIKNIFPRFDVSADGIIARMEHDKKTEGGRPVFILVRDIGQAWVSRDVDLADARAVIEQSMQG